MGAFNSGDLQAPAGHSHLSIMLAWVRGYSHVTRALGIMCQLEMLTCLLQLAELSGSASV